MKIAIGSDHAGYRLKQALVEHLRRRGVEVVDVGSESDADSVDYPDYAAAVGRMVSVGEADQGVLVCGTGIGMSITANKFRSVRAALVHDLHTARLAREHNDANVLVLGGRLLAAEHGCAMVDAWLDAQFESRHQRRLAKIAEIEGAGGNGPA